MDFEGGLTAALTMVAFTEEICLRKTSIYGSKVRHRDHLCQYFLSVKGFIIYLLILSQGGIVLQWI